MTHITTAIDIVGYAGEMEIGRTAGFVRFPFPGRPQRAREVIKDVPQVDRSHLGLSVQLTNRRFISDPEIGAVVGFIRWPSGVPDSHLFRVENGKLRLIV
jgi:hypothetical protein